MTASELKYQVEQSGTNPYFFTRSTMKFFGDTMSNYGVRSTEIKATIIDSDTEVINVWELHRKQPVKHGLQSSTFFNKTTFKREYSIKVKV